MICEVSECLTPKIRQIMIHWPRSGGILRASFNVPNIYIKRDVDSLFSSLKYIMYLSHQLLTQQVQIKKTGKIILKLYFLSFHDFLRKLCWLITIRKVVKKPHCTVFSGGKQYL